MSSNATQDQNQTALLTDSALEELKLSQQPFVGPIADDQTFLDSIAEAQLEDIKQALMSGDDLLLILGPEGSGKSVLLGQLGVTSGQRIQCFSVRGSERFSTTNLFAGMLEAFKKDPPNDLKLMLDELIPSLQGMADHNTLGAVVLDDADLVSEAELTKLLSSMLYINSGDETLLRITLAAPTEFEERIPELLPEGADLPYSSLAIDAFDKDRSAAYLNHRLKLAGAAGDFPFTEEDLIVINAEAGGRPGDLHTVAAQNLNNRNGEYEYATELPPELASPVAAVNGPSFLSRIGGKKLLAGLAALLMIFAGLFLLKPKTDTVPDERYKVVEQKKIDTAKQLEAQQLNKQRQAELIAAEKLAAKNKAKAATSAAAVVDSGNTTGQSTNSTAASVDNDADARAKLQAQLERDAAAKAAAEKATNEKRIAQEQAEKAKAAAAAKAADEKRIAQEQAKKAAAEAAAKKAAEEQAAKEKAEAEQKAQLNLSNLESPNWILVQNPALFTVQMIAATDRASVERFLAKTQLDAPNSIFSFNRGDVTWFALAHGLYASIEEARKDIERMPENARNNQPWIRAVGRIQNAVKEQ